MVGILRESPRAVTAGHMNLLALATFDDNYIWLLRDASGRALITAQPAAGNTLLQMVLRQGFNRQIRRMCRDLGLTVLRLCRVAQGALRLGNLASGKARPLTDAEIANLRESAGLTAIR